MCERWSGYAKKWVIRRQAESHLKPLPKAIVSTRLSMTDILMSYMVF